MIRDWLAKRPRWHVHLTPTSSSWLNQVERFFALITDKQIRRGVHNSVGQLKTCIARFIDQHNAAPKPFRWTKSVPSASATPQSRQGCADSNFWFGTLGCVDGFNSIRPHAKLMMAE